MNSVSRQRQEREDPGNEVVQDGCRFTTHALLPIFPEESCVLNELDTCGYVWTDKFDLTTDTCRHESGKKSCGFKNTRIRVEGALIDLFTDTAGILN